MLGHLRHHGSSGGLAPGDARFLVEHLPDIVARGSNDGTIEWISPSVRSVAGWAPDELIGRPFLQFVHPDDAAAVRAVQADLLAGATGAFETRLRCSDGTYRWISISIRPIFDEDGTAIGRVACLHDIHQQRTELHRHLVRNNRLESALEAMTDPYICAETVRDTNGVVTDFIVTNANGAASRHFSQPTHAIVGALASVLVPADQFEEFVATSSKVLATGTPFAADARPRPGRSEQDLRWFDARVTRIDENTVSATWRDVSAAVRLARAEIEVAASRAQTDERERIGRDLHDGLLQMILASGMVTASLLARVGTADIAIVEHAISLHDQEVSQLRAMMLGMATAPIGGMGAAAQIRRIVEEAARVLGFRPSITLTGALDHVEVEVIEHLTLALRELLSNVARHAEATSVSVTVDASDAQVIVTVIDDGVGFTAHDSPGRGLHNLDDRAHELGGSFTLAPGAAGGTTAVWTAALGHG